MSGLAEGRPDKVVSMALLEEGEPGFSDEMQAKWFALLQYLAALYHSKQ